LPLIKYAAAAILMGSCVRLFSFPSRVLGLLARAGIGAILYFGLILLLDKKVRMLARQGLRTLRGHSSEPMEQSVAAADQ
jgi:hypothetical protein